MISEVLLSTAIALAQSPNLCKQKTYDQLYRTLTLIDIQLANEERKIENTCTADFKFSCKYSEKDQMRLNFFKSFRYKAVMAMRKKCNGLLSTYEKLN